MDHLTSGYAKPEIFARLTDAADILLFDVKHCDAKKHEAYTGVNNDRILANLR